MVKICKTHNHFQVLHLSQLLRQVTSLHQFLWGNERELTRPMSCRLFSKVSFKYVFSLCEKFYRNDPDCHITLQCYHKTCNHFRLDSLDDINWDMLGGSGMGASNTSQSSTQKAPVLPPALGSNRSWMDDLPTQINRSAPVFNGTHISKNSFLLYIGGSLTVWTVLSIVRA